MEMPKSLEMSRLCVPYTPFIGDVRKSSVCLVTTAGVHLKSDKPFALEGDITYRTIPADVDAKKLMVTHEHYDHSDADIDINCVFPMDRLRRMVDKGKIGSLTGRHFSTGYCQAFRELREVTVPAIVAEVTREKADIVLLTGGWPLCHRTVVSIQRGIEMVGIPTVLITVDKEQSEMGRPSRAICPKRFKIGNSLGGAHQEQLHMKVLGDALRLLNLPLIPGLCVEMDYPEYTEDAGG